MSDHQSPFANKCAAAAKSTSIDGVHMPAVMTDLVSEYKCIRERVAMSDQSHYGKFEVSGADAADFLNFINLPDILRLPIGKVASSFLLSEDGGLFAECYLVSSGDTYLLLTEARNSAEVLSYLKQHAANFAVSIQDITQDYGMVELDGPFAWELLKDLIGVKVLGLRYLETLEKQNIGGAATHIIRAGKTGEFGYTLLVSKEQAEACWDALVEAGKRYDMMVVGFEALDQCRLENRFPNLRIEGAKLANPLEMNCRVMFDKEKDDHLGRQAIESLFDSGPKRRIVGVIAVDEASESLPLGSMVMLGDECVGEVVNTGHSPMLGRSVALALINNDVAYVGLRFSVGTDAPRPIHTVSAPFVFNKSLSIRPQEHSYHSQR